MGSSMDSNVSIKLLFSIVLTVFVLCRSLEHRNPEGDFKINVLNSVVFLMQASMTISTFAANYEGRPFMQDLRENQTMSRLILGSLVVIFLSALDFLTPLTEFLEIAPLPNEEFRQNLVLLLAFDFFFVLFYERFLRKYFAINKKAN
jgi:cation-transporting ATPase 13A1